MQLILLASVLKDVLRLCKNTFLRRIKFVLLLWIENLLIPPKALSIRLLIHFYAQLRSFNICVDFIGFISGMSNKKTRFNSVLHSSWSIWKREITKTWISIYLQKIVTWLENACQNNKKRVSSYQIIYRNSSNLVRPIK